MDKETKDSRMFDMGALETNLPQNRRGLSRYYSGKSRSFTCMADVQCVEDLKKQEIPDAKKRKKYSNRQGLILLPPLPCRRVFSTTQCSTPYVGLQI
ncbi:hypothetical protein HHK36_010189 [Tetracentron sinense]|uniref:Uncharacterized protein n=1 Tax=Tetracentron sinense TaxID=13715 RepID=A0A835DM56_TETSI|nr:hypothetical protein HHK36_010189 [Tetracentron sinense]